MASLNMHAVAKAAVPQQLSNYIFIVAHQTRAEEIVNVNHDMKHKFTKQLGYTNLGRQPGRKEFVYNP